jgi:hypothetical protein
MKPIFLPYENDEALSATEFFREIAKGEADGLAVVDEDCRASDTPPHPLSKLFGDVELFYSPSPEQKQSSLQKGAKTSETTIGNTTIVATFDADGVCIGTHVKGTK